ncbi:hypothetical protein GQS40_13555|uniref:Uncharacterized protein n=1 Tax=Leuconostoc lactis TaxID=1246 RepID=A0A6L7AHL0_LEULA|nr:hypothetical protein [Leuconostoc lactis]
MKQLEERIKQEGRVLHRLSNFEIEHIDDVRVEISQAEHMADLAVAVIASVVDAYGNLSSRDLDWTMKLLTVYSIVLTVPTIPLMMRYVEQITEINRKRRVIQSQFGHQKRTTKQMNDLLRLQTQMIYIQNSLANNHVMLDTFKLDFEFDVISYHDDVVETRPIGILFAHGDLYTFSHTVTDYVQAVLLAPENRQGRVADTDITAIDFVMTGLY